VTSRRAAAAAAAAAVAAGEFNSPALYLQLENIGEKICSVW